MAQGETQLIVTAEQGVINYCQTTTSPFGARLFNRNNRPCLLFIDSTFTFSFFHLIMPQHYGGNGIEINLHFTCTTSTGDIYWLANVQNNASGDDIDSGTYGSSAATLQGPDGPDAGNAITVATLTIPPTDMDNMAAGDAFVLRIGRIGSYGTDTCTGMAQLHVIEIRERS